MKVTNMYDKAFWQDTAVRTVNTFFQAFVGAIGTNAILLNDVRWPVAASTGALAAILYVCKALSVPPDAAAYRAHRALQ